MLTPISAASAEARAEANQCLEDVMRQNAVARQPHERGGDDLQRRKQLRRKQAEMRHRFPHRADHDEGKRIARRTPQRAALDSSGR